MGDKGIKIIDFDTAKLEGFPILPHTISLNKTAYMPRSQMNGLVNEKTDVFALGTIMFELLTGLLPQEFEVPPDIAKGLPEEAKSVFIHAANPRNDYGVKDMVKDIKKVILRC